MIMDLKERVARPSSSFSPSSFLLKSDLHFAAKVRKRFCFRRQKATERERERAMENAFFCSFALFRSFVSRSAAVTRPVSRYDKVVREEYGDFDDLCEVYGRARHRRLSCIFKNYTINEKTEKPRRFTKYAAPYIARVNEL